MGYAKQELGVEEVCGAVSYANVKSGKLMERIACQTCVGGEKAVQRGDGALMRPGKKIGVERKDEVGCWTWKWLL